MSEFALMDRGLTSIFDALASVQRAEPIPPPLPRYHFHVTRDGVTVEFHSEAELLAWLREAR